MGEPPDGVVIQASLREPERFEVIFDRHYDAVRRYAQRRLGPATGEEVAAQTFLVAFDRRSTFRLGAASARPWLLGIASNLLRHHLREEQTHLRILAGIGVEAAEPAPDNPERLDAQRLGPVIADELAALSPDDRNTFLLFAVGDLSYFEVADALAIPVGTVRSRIHRVRLRLREQLGPLRERPIDG